jgi:chorismate mutase
MNDEIAKLREKIDSLDLEILELLNRRADCALAIGEIKRQLHLPVYMPVREKDVLANVTGNNPGPWANAAVVRLYERIIDESRRLERERSD